MQPTQQRSEIPWFITWRDSDGRFPLRFPVRVVNAIELACNGPNKCRAGAILGSVEPGAAGDQLLQIIHAITFETDEQGQLDAAARDRLNAGSPNPNKAVMTLGVFVPEGPGEPQGVCALLAAYKPLFPASMVVAVVGRSGVAQFYEWRLRDDKLVALSPDLRLRAPFSPQEPDLLESRRHANTVRAPAPARPGETTGPATASGITDKLVRSMPMTVAQPLHDVSGVTVRFDVPKWLLLGFLLLSICMLGTGIWYYGMIIRQNELSTQPPTSSSARGEATDGKRLDLQVSRRGNDLLINWDHNLQTTIGARHGVLQITDGNEPMYLPLSLRDLTSGQVLYVPRSQDIEIQLTAFTESSSLHETIRVVQPGAARGAETTRPIPFTARQNATTPLRVPQSPPLPTAPAQSAPGTTPDNDVTRRASDHAARQVVLPPAPVKAANQQPAGTIRESTNPPSVSAAAQQPSEPPVEITPLTPVQTPPPLQQQSQSESQLQQQQPSSAPGQPSAPAITAAPRVVDFRPPTPIRQVKPTVPDTLKRMLLRDTPVSVKLKIDANGNVLSAEAERGSGVTGLLATVAEMTARSWRFRPATVDGKPMPADYTITFMFRR